MMGDRERFVRVLGNVTFRDWRFRVGTDGGYRHEGGPCWVQIEFDAPDSFTGEAGVQRGRKWRLSKHMTDSEIVQTALTAVLAGVEHEAREDFRYRGEAIFGPHFSVDCLLVLAKADATDARQAA